MLPLSNNLNLFHSIVGSTKKENFHFSLAGPQNFQADSVGGVGVGEWAMVEQTQISGRVRMCVGRKDWDKTGEGSREGHSRENWRELISIDHHRQLHYQHLLDTWWIHNHFLLCVGGSVHACAFKIHHLYTTDNLPYGKVMEKERYIFSVKDFYDKWYTLI